MLSPMLEKYGVKHALESEKFLQKMKDTNQENWGVPYTTQSPVVIEKIKKSLQEKYNVDNVFKLREFQELATQVKEKTKEIIHNITEQNDKIISFLNLRQKELHDKFDNTSFDIKDLISQTNSWMDTVKDKLDKLNDMQKKIIRLRYFEDKTQVEVAKIMNISQVKVSRLEKKILNFLKGIM